MILPLFLTWSKIAEEKYTLFTDGNIPVSHAGSVVCVLTSFSFPTVLSTWYKQRDTELFCTSRVDKHFFYKPV